jgi:hypothetical protein
MIRIIALEKDLLSPREAFEYKWSVCYNIQGGTGKNIPNDNMVEIQVTILKEALKNLGPNVNYDTARLTVRTAQTTENIIDNLIKQSEMHKTFHEENTCMQTFTNGH